MMQRGRAAVVDPGGPMGCLDDNVLSSHLAGTLGRDEAPRVSAHLDECPRCADLLTVLARAYPAEPSLATVTQPSLGPFHGDSQTTGELGASPAGVAIEPQPASIGRYVIVGPLGRGGMGVVYAAYDPKLDRNVAIKLLRARATSEAASRAAQSTLMREARTMARVSHPNVLVVHDVGAHDGRVFLVMDFVDGGTLRQWLRSEARAPAEILKVVIEAGQGLSAAQRTGLVHRDFKPDNVLISQDGRVFVADFGLTRRAPAAGAPRTEAERWAGTPAYAAPEVKGGLEADARSDQYSFCVTLHEALFGTRPSANKAALTTSPVPSAAVAPEVQAALARGLAADPDARFPTMDELLTTLAPFAVQTSLAESDASSTRGGGVRQGARRWLGSGALALAIVVSVFAGRALVPTKTLPPQVAASTAAPSEPASAAPLGAASAEHDEPVTVSAPLETAAAAVAAPGAPPRIRPRSSPLGHAGAGPRLRPPGSGSPIDPLARQY